MRTLLRGLDVVLGAVAVALFLRLVLEVSIGPNSVIAAVVQALTDPLLSPFNGMTSSMVRGSGSGASGSLIFAVVAYAALYVVIDRLLRAVARHSP